jgi:hypothetical protein
MTRKLLFALFFFSCFAKAQLQIDNTLTPAQLVENVLVGEGVVPFNIKFNRGPSTAIRDQASKFSSNFNPTGLGLDGGILLTTGKSSVALGPNSNVFPGGQVSDPTDIPVEGDVDSIQLWQESVPGDESRSVPDEALRSILPA